MFLKSVTKTDLDTPLFSKNVTFFLNEPNIEPCLRTATATTRGRRSRRRGRCSGRTRRESRWTSATPPGWPAPSSIWVKNKISSSLMALAQIDKNNRVYSLDDRYWSYFFIMPRDIIQAPAPSLGSAGTRCSSLTLSPASRTRAIRWR